MREYIPVLELQNKFTIRMFSKSTHIGSLLSKTLWHWVLILSGNKCRYSTWFGIRPFGNLEEK